MPIERRRDLDLNSGMHAANLLDQSRQIPLQVEAQREKVWNHDDVGDPAPGQNIHRAAQIRRAALEKRGLHRLVSSAPGHLSRYRPDRIIRRFDARPVREHDIARVFQIATARPEDSSGDSGR